MSFPRVLSFSVLALTFLAAGPGAFAASEIGTTVSTHKRTAKDLGSTRPEWSFQLDGTVETLGGTRLENSKAFAAVPMTALHFNYQPAFLQPVGVFSFGTGLAFFPVNSSTGGLQRTPASWSAGAEARYQARFFRKQWLVPTAALGAQYLAYQLSDGTSGRVLVRTPSAGLMVLLNAVDPGNAVDFFESYGAQRTYLLAELRRSEGNDPKIAFSGNSFFFGLRIEY